MNTRGRRGRRRWLGIVALVFGALAVREALMSARLRREANASGGLR
jgi:hypothetical protein